MPKQKTKSSAKKRFKITGSGKIMHKHTKMRHLMRRKTKKQKRHLSATGEVFKTDLGNVKFMLKV